MAALYCSAGQRDFVDYSLWTIISLIDEKNTPAV
jgi:hypothetical protein